MTITRNYIFFETDKMKFREIFDSAMSFLQSSPKSKVNNYIDTSTTPVEAAGRMQQGKKIMIRLKNNTRDQIRAQVKAIQHQHRRLRNKYNKHAHKLLSVSSSKIRRRIGIGSSSIKNSKFKYPIFSRKMMTRKSLSKRFNVNRLKTKAAVNRAVAMTMEMTMANTKKPLSSSSSLLPLTPQRESYKKQTAKFKQWRKNKQTNLTNYYRYQRSLLRHNTEYIWNIIYKRLQKQPQEIPSSSSTTSMTGTTSLTSPSSQPNIQKQIKSILRNLILHSKHTVTINEPFQKNWFSNRNDGSLGYPLTSRDPKNGRFVNPWNSVSTNGWKQLSDVWRWKKTRMIGYDIEHGLSGKDKDSLVDPLATSKSNANDNVSSNTNSNDNSTTSKAAKLSPTDVITSTNHNIDYQLTPPSSPDKIKLTWVGHATTLIQMAGFTIITDPVFSHKASPIQYFSKSELLGVPRRLPPSFTIDDIHYISGGDGDDRASGGIDFCLISHDHYDHLDYDSVKQLHERNLIKFWIVPLGLKDWLMQEIGIDDDRIVELEWWQSVMFKNNSCDQYFTKDNNMLQMERINDVLEWSPSSSSSSASAAGTNVGLDERSLEQLLHVVEDESKDDMKYDPQKENHDDFANEIVLTCAPAQHWCSRSPFDRNTRLWCSWAVHTKTIPPPPNMINSSSSPTNKNSRSDMEPQELSFYFAGDTGYPKSFPLHRQIGDRLGPFDLSAIPIGAYKPRFFMHDSHCDPFESVKIHKDIRSKKSVAIHWGTFPLANEPFDEPPHLLGKAVKLEVERVSAERGTSDFGHDDDDSEAKIVDFVAIPQGETIESKSQIDSHEDEVDIYESLKHHTA